MAEIQFYHLTSTPLERALPKLLEKSLQAGFKVRVKTESEERAENLSTLLWTFDPASFLPHGTAKDGYGETQPVFLTANEASPNNADLLIVIDGSGVKPDHTLRRILDMFDGNNEAAVSAARARWKQYQAEGHAVSYIKQNAAGGWEKQGT